MARIFKLSRKTTTNVDLGDIDKKVIKALNDRDMSDREMSIVTKTPMQDIRKSIDYLRYIKVIREI